MADRAWWASDIVDLARRLDSGPDGIGSAEATRRSRGGRSHHRHEQTAITRTVSGRRLSAVSTLRSASLQSAISSGSQGNEKPRDVSHG